MDQTGGGGGITAATGTNIAAYQAQIATNALPAPGISAATGTNIAAWQAYLSTNSLPPGITNIAAWQAYLATNSLPAFISAATGTNIAAWQAYLATNGLFPGITNLSAYQAYLATNSLLPGITNIAAWQAYLSTNGLSSALLQAKIGASVYAPYGALALWIGDADAAGFSLNNLNSLSLTGGLNAAQMTITNANFLNPPHGSGIYWTNAAGFALAGLDASTNIAAWQAYLATNSLPAFISAATATNIAAWQAYLSTNSLPPGITNIAAWQAYLSTNGLGSVFLGLHAKADTAGTADTANAGWPATWAESAITGLAGDLAARITTNDSRAIALTGALSTSSSLTAASHETVPAYTWTAASNGTNFNVSFGARLNLIQTTNMYLSAAAGTSDNYQDFLAHIKGAGKQLNFGFVTNLFGAYSTNTVTLGASNGPWILTIDRFTNGTCCAVLTPPNN